MNLPDGYIDVPPGKQAAVVTSLQMTARPEARPERPADGWTLRRVERPDLDWYRDLYRRVGQDWLWFSRMSMPDDALAAILHAPAVEVYALEVDGMPEGLLELDFREPGECELAFFGLTAAAQGTGAGRWLMNRALERAWAHPITRLWVHTCTFDHPAALSFYRRSGFVPFRQQIEIADDPRLTGALPRDAAPQVPIIERP
ncbi:MAG: GNAT family N-acetyltransferase [Thalassobaculum sp.]|uniref:GNAT family N-acetyltransferase n=1 Tax=Thalassobaculum sp. TaxID=2022740 RepID=UPI0032EC73A0